MIAFGMDMHIHARKSGNDDELELVSPFMLSNAYLRFML
tara:strand:+ start:4861 stop:4977 length:117 start_codon:yes stop_codon:yes gene_type:complete